MERPEVAEVGNPKGDLRLKAVMDTHEAALTRYASRMLRNPDAAHDVVQTAFIRLHERWDECSQWAGDHVRNWLYRTTHNAAVDLIRHEERLRKLHASHAKEIEEAVPPDQTEALDLADRRQLVLQHIDGLEEAERTILLLRMQRGLSYEEIARETGRTEGNVGCILHHAVKHLGQRLKKAGVLDE